jgi:hypothetical protein
MVVAALTVAAMAAPGAAAFAADASPAARPAPAALLTAPEDAVREYLAGLAATDVPRILGAAAIDEIAEGFDFVEQIDRIQAFVPSLRMAPAEDPFWVELNRVTRTGEVLDRVRYLIYSLLTDETIDGNPIAPVDRAWAQAFALQVDPERLAGLAVLDIGVANREMLESEGTLEILARQARVQSADELTERVALVSFEGDLYVVGFTLGRFGDEWKVVNQFAPVSGMDALGTAKPTTQEAWEELTSEG